MQRPGGAAGIAQRLVPVSIRSGEPEISEYVLLTGIVGLGCHYRLFIVACGPVRRRCNTVGQRLVQMVSVGRNGVSHSMINQNWWFTTLLVKQFQYCPPLNKSIKCDVLIVGGGMTGISAAAEFLRSGLKVVMIDKNIIGGSSTGRSAGFLTPDSELELHQLVRRYGIEAAREIWEMPCRGIDRLVENIQKFDIQCGLLKQDSLFLGLGKSGKEAVEEEMECRQDVGFTDQKLYDAKA